MSLKKSIALVSSVALALGLVACGDSSNTAKDNSDNADCTPQHADIQTLTEGTLKVAAPVTPPYLTKEGGEFGGVDTAVLERIAKMECLDIDWQEVQYAAGLQGVQSKRLDVFIGGLYRTDDREKIMALGQTVYRDGMNLLSRDGYTKLEDLEGKNVGVIQGYLWNADLQRELGDSQVKQFQTSDALFNDLKAGRVDVAVLTTAEAAHRLAQDPDLGLKSEAFEPTEKVGPSMQPGEVTFPIEISNTSLRKAFDADIKELHESGEIAKILEEYKMDPELSGDA